MVQASEVKPPGVTWRARVRAGWQNLHLAERIAWIVAIALVVFGVEIGGFFVVATSEKGIAYVVNRFTGSVSLCLPNGCKGL